jgi:hypothetical protein
VILFLPEHELHELALLFFNFIIKKAGHETLYLGQSNPFSSVVRVNNSWKADIIITGMMSGYPEIIPDEFISQLAKSFPKQKILIAGVFADHSLKSKFRNVFQIRSSEELKYYL